MDIEFLASCQVYEVLSKRLVYHDTLRSLFNTIVNAQGLYLEPEDRMRPRTFVVHVSLGVLAVDFSLLDLLHDVGDAEDQFISLTFSEELVLG
jgi:hypothetical protein